ncbi:hypothetical protein HZA33_00050 [Candidatus Pacearchaeota archaeon]|nr:hypothetical protein [Candidatus Pacearchaeota archaeon]
MIKMCKKCKTNAVFVMINGRKLCKNCFIHYFEKKILFTIRKYNLLRKGNKIFIDKGRYTTIIEHIFRKLPIYKISKIKTKTDKILLSTSIGNIACQIILNQLKKKQEVKQLMPKYKNTIKPLYLLLDKEIELYAKLNKIKINKQKDKDKLGVQVRNFLNDLEKKHPEIKYAAVNAFLEIEPVL